MFLMFSCAQKEPESQAMHLETRVAQLDSAIQMEVWQEVFKAVENIHGLNAWSKVKYD